MPAADELEENLVEPREKAILRVAAQLFQQNGFEGTPVTRIAKACSMTPANLYWYFPSKQHLLAAVLVDLYRSSYHALQNADDPAASPSTRLVSYVRTLVLTQLGDESESSSFGYLALQSSLDDEAAEEVTDWQRAHRALLKAILEAGEAAGAFDIPDASVAASMIMTSAEYVFLWYREGGRLARIDVADRYAELALRIVGASAAD